MYVCKILIVQQQHSRMPERGWHSGQKRRTNLPTHDVLQQYSSTAADALVQTELMCRTPTDAPTYLPTTCYSNTAVQQQMRWHKPSCCVAHWDFHFLTIPRHSGERAIRPREGLSTPPALRVGHRRPFFRRCVRGLLCGTGVEPPRGRGRPSGGLASQVSFGYL